jgi:signal peptidase II
MFSTRALRLLAVFLVLLSTAGCDQATKHFARTGLAQWQSSPIAGGLIELTLAENPGTFLSLGASLPEPLRGTLLTFGIGIGLACLLIYLVRNPALRWSSFLALSLVWAGGTSNLLDRFSRNGLVTDFILLRLGPFHTGIFNLADMAIVAGIIILAASSFRPTKAQTSREQ